MQFLLYILSIFIVNIYGSTQNEFGDAKQFHTNSVSNGNWREDEFLRTNKLIKKYGYPYEEHHVTTADGYILTMHRIPREGAVPVLVTSGLLYASSVWVIMGPDKGLAYLLFDEGYDVWLLDTRGNTYSRQHKKLSTYKAKFWDFTFHEIGFYDIPASIDYVLRKNGHKKLQYIGHSQGSAVFFVMCTLLPEYNNKIITMQSLSPVVFVGGGKSPIANLAAVFENQIFNFLEFIGYHEFLPENGLIKRYGQPLCKFLPRLMCSCEDALFLITGFDGDQFNSTMLPVIFGHIPAGSSTKQVRHFVQLKSSGRFCNFDYGKARNLQMYGKSVPPEYDLSKVTAKVAIHYGANDWLCVPSDVDKLKHALPNVIGSFLIDFPHFNHADFLWAIDARELLYNRIIKSMKAEEATYIEKIGWNVKNES